ncbi:MAG: glycosyltransferase family 2 protein [Candidatus Roizmanbacteria bacterium]
MRISTIVVAEGLCPDISLTLSSAKDVSAEVILVDIGLEPSIRTQLESDNPDIKIFSLPKPDYVELIRQETLAYAAHDWVLLLDPDEYLSPELVKLIRESALDEGYTHLKIPRQNYIFNKWISHSRWWPDYQIRLFRKDSMNWPKTLHAQPELTGKGFIVGAFEDQKLEMRACAIVHHNYTSILQYLEKAIRYARVDANSITVSNEPYTILDASKRATSEFISRFFADKGYKDGVHGLILAILQVFYNLLVYMFVWEKQSYPEVTQTNLFKATYQLFITTSKEMLYWMSREKIVKGPQKVMNWVKRRVM